MPYINPSPHQNTYTFTFDRRSTNILSLQLARSKPNRSFYNCTGNISCLLKGKFNRGGKLQKKTVSIEEKNGENFIAKFATPISIIGGLATLLTRSEMRFDAMDRKLSQHDTQFALINKNFENIDKRFEGIDKRFEGIDKRFENIENDIKSNSVEIQKVKELIKDELINELRRKISSSQAQ